MRELPVTLEEIKNKALDNNSIVTKKKPLKIEVQQNPRYVHFAMTWWYFYHYRNEFLKNSTLAILVYPERKA